MSECAECSRLRQRVIELQRQITVKDQSLHEKNLSLDALHYVWCDGGCEGGVHRFTAQGPQGEITAELVAEAERNTLRLARWWRNVEARRTRALSKQGGRGR